MIATPGKSPIDASIWERVVQFNRPPSAVAARALLKLCFAPEDLKRIRELAAKARAATLTDKEEAEAEAYERLGCLLDILHSQARRALKGRGTAS